MVHSDLDKGGKHQGAVSGMIKVDALNDRTHVSLEVFKALI